MRGPISDPRGPYVRTQSIRLKLRCDQKVRTLLFLLFVIKARAKGGTATHDGGFAIGPLREVYEAGVRGDLSKW